MIIGISEKRIILLSFFILSILLILSIDSQTNSLRYRERSDFCKHD
jgi:hypothetical protein